MNTSLFVEYVAKWFGAIAKRFVERINDSKGAPAYLFKTMLRSEYSPTLKWESQSVSRSVVAADIVSMDSPLPLKKRDSLGKASGDIPKVGMKLRKSEKLISDINVMKARGASETQIVQRIFDDTSKVISGVYERAEIMFLQAISTGYTLIPDTENVGTAIRADFGYLDANKFGVSKKWTDPGYTPLTDIEDKISKAAEKGDVITTIMLDKAEYNKIRKSEEAKQRYAASIGYAGASMPIPTPSQFNMVMEDEFNIKFLIVDRSARYEKDGKQTVIKPFALNTLVLLTSEQTGTLSYGTLAEETNPVECVNYQKVDEYILVSKYSKNDPLEEFTSSQALLIPVIENVDSIYLVDTNTVQA